MPPLPRRNPTGYTNPPDSLPDVEPNIETPRLDRNVPDTQTVTRRLEARGIGTEDGSNVQDEIDDAAGGPTQAEFDALDGEVSTNTTNISSNTADIATNTADIATNTSDISAIENKAFTIAPFASDEAVETGDGTIAAAVPAEMNGWSLTDVCATVHDKGVTNTTDVQVRRYRAGASVDMLSTLVTIGDEYFARDGVIKADGSEVLATGDRIYIDVDAVHSGTPPNGLSVVCTFTKP